MEGVRGEGVKKRSTRSIRREAGSVGRKEQPVKKTE
jgi:hypothetical protein